MGTAIRIKNHRRFTGGGPWRNCHLCAQYEDDQPTADEEVDLTVACGRMHPESEMVEHEGHWYCAEHFRFRFARELREASPIVLEEESP